MKLQEKSHITNKFKMLKYFHLTIFVMLCLVNYFCIAQNPNPKEDWQKEDLICKAARMKTIRFSQGEKFGEPIDIVIDSVSILFNTNGKYLKKVSNCFKNQSDCYNRELVYNYADNSNYLSSFEQIKGWESYRVDYKYSNSLVETEYYPYKKVRIDGSNISKKEYQYDSKGNNKRIEFYDDQENIYIIWIYEYNSNNKIIEEKHYDSYGIMKTSFKYSYDIKGNLLTYESSRDKKREQRKAYTYDTKNNILSEMETNFGVYSSPYPYSSYFKYIFDSKGKIIKETKTNKYGLEHIIEYTSYDKNGNWIMKKVTEYVENKPKGIIKYNRSIEY